VEVSKPDLLQHVLNLFSLVVSHDVSNESSISAHALQLIDFGDGCLEELAEIISDREIDQDLLIEGSVIVSLDSLDGLQLGEVAKRV